MKHKYYVGDTENTVPKATLYGDPQTETDAKETHVWAACVGEVSLNPEKPKVFSNLEDYLSELLSYKNAIIFFHNLAYDGPLIVTQLLKDRYQWVSEKPCPHEFSALVSPEGTWYEVVINNGNTIKLRDSYKLLPFSVDKIGSDFKTKEKKLKGSIDYTKERPIGYEMTETERRYIENDVLVLQEALALLEEEEPGFLNALTIGSNAMKSFIKILGKGEYRRGLKNFQAMFPKLDLPLDEDLRKAYSGGWCYKADKADGIFTVRPMIIRPELNRQQKRYVIKKSSKLHHINGSIFVYDVNSLYPYVMRDREYPMGYPTEFSGDEFDKYVNNLFIIEAEVAFTVKPEHYPCIQIKKSRFIENEWLKSSDGIITKTFTKPEWELFNEQYDLDYCVIKRGWSFAKGNPFAAYIDHWYDKKKNAKTPCQRTLAKLMLNNLYGKFGTKPIRDAGRLELEDDILKIKRVEDIEGCIEDYMNAKTYGYIPVAAFCTAYARCVTVRAAQANYGNFLYSDTDSIHIIGEAKNIPVSPSELGAWKCENEIETARYVRQKTYAEYAIKKDGDPVEPYMIIKACGAPSEVKERMMYHVGREDDHWEKLDVEQAERRSVMNFMNRFDFGLVEPGKRTKRRVKGGSVIVETTFRIAERKPV